MLTADARHIVIGEDLRDLHRASDHPRHGVGVRVGAIAIVAVLRDARQPGVGVAELSVVRVAVAHRFILVVLIHRILTLGPHEVGGEQFLDAGLRVESGKLLGQRDVTEMPARTERQRTAAALRPLAAGTHLRASGLAGRRGDSDVCIQPHTHGRSLTVGVCYHRWVELPVFGIEHLVRDASLLRRIFLADGIAGGGIGKLLPLTLRADGLVGELRVRANLFTG